MGLSGWLAGYDGSFSFESGAEYPEGLNYTTMRVFNAFFGAMMVPISYLTAVQLKMSLKASLLTATMVLLGRHPWHLQLLILIYASFLLR